VAVPISVVAKSSGSEAALSLAVRGRGYALNCQAKSCRQGQRASHSYRRM